MTESELVRRTLDAVDGFVDDLRLAAAGRTPFEPVALVVDVGRAAVEWRIEVELDGSLHELGLVVVCDVGDGVLRDARLYAPALRARTIANPASEA